MKIKKQTRTLAAGCSKHCFEVVDRTDEVSSKYCFEVVDETDEVNNHTYGKAKLTWFEEIFEEYYFPSLSGKINPIPTQARTPAPITRPLEIGKRSKIAFAMMNAIIKHMRLAL